MPHLLARANETVLETQRLRREGRALRMEAAILASTLGQTVRGSTVTAEGRAHSPGPDQQGSAAHVANRQR
jgi:hypothetical protein